MTNSPSFVFPKQNHNFLKWKRIVFIKCKKRVFPMYFHKFSRDSVPKFPCNLENEAEEEMNFHMISWAARRGCGVAKEKRRWGVAEEGSHIKGESEESRRDIWERCSLEKIVYRPWRKMLKKKQKLSLKEERRENKLS